MHQSTVASEDRVMTDQGTGYSTYGLYHFLDRAPKGRDEDSVPAGEWWWRRHDEHEDGEGRRWPSA